jgi:hypothetical protein
VEPPGSAAIASAIGVDHIHAYAATADAGHDSTQGGGSATTPSDHLAKIVRVYVDFQGTTSAGSDQTDSHLVRMVNNAANEVFQCVREETHASPSLRSLNA